MKRIKLAIGLFMIGMTLGACSSSSGDSDSLIDSLKKLSASNYKEIDIDDQYSIEISDALKTYPGLNDDASLEYANIYDEQYIIVIDEDKQDFIDVYKEIGEYDENKSVIENYEYVQSSFMAEAGDITYESKVNTKKVNGLSARQKQVDAVVEDVPEPVSYWLGYIEGKERLYTIMAWTLTDKKDDFKEDAEHMINSLKEKK